MTNLKWITPAIIAAGFALAGVPALHTADAQSPRLVQTSVSDDGMARSADTVADDLRLINRCIDNGRSKAECLCVTQVMKYEMTLTDYRRAARAYTLQASVVTRGQNVQAEPAKRVEGDISAMVSAPNFEYRCAAARDYFARAR